MTFSVTKFSVYSAAALMFAAPNLAAAQTASSLSGLYACEVMADKDAQLACFLAETAKLRGAERAEPVVQMDKKSLDAPLVNSAPAVPSQSEALAEKPAMAETKTETKKDKKKKAKATKIRSLAIRSASKYGNKGYVRFTLENGEVWRQTQPGRVRLGGASPDILTIRKASFGSFLARVNGTGTGIRIKQVK